MKDFILKILNVIKNITFRVSFTLTALIRWLSKKKRLKIDMTFDIDNEEEEKQRRKEEVKHEETNHENF